MTNKTLILVIGFLGMLLIVAFSTITLLVPGDKTIPYVGLGVVAGLFIPQLMTMKSSNENAERIKQVDHALAAASVQTGVALQEVAQKQDTTNHLVNGQLTTALAENRILSARLDVLEKDKTEKTVAAAQAESSETRIIAAVVAASPVATPLGTPIADIEQSMPSGQSKMGDQH